MLVINGLLQHHSLEDHILQEPGLEQEMLLVLEPQKVVRLLKKPSF